MSRTLSRSAKDCFPPPEDRATYSWTTPVLSPLSNVSRFCCTARLLTRGAS